MKKDGYNIMFWHGYLLSGTGSNIYTQYLSREFCRQGHTVHLFSQDIEVIEYDFITEFFKFNEQNNCAAKIVAKETPYAGKCYAYQPNIGSILPVYVYDAYQHFTAKTFLEMTEAELDSYIAANLRALDWFFGNHKVDFCLVNHTIMGPYFLARSNKRRDITYAVVSHGSDLEFTVKKSRRYLEFAKMGVEPAAKIIAVTKHIEKKLVDLFGYQLRSRIVSLPSGVDVDRFRPAADRRLAVEELYQSIASWTKPADKGFDDRLQGKTLRLLNIDSRLETNLKRIHAGYNDRHPDRNLGQKLRIANDDKLILFIGKLMTTKGVHLALAALPLVISRTRKVKLIVVGFGELREPLELFANALDAADWERIRDIARIIDSKSETPYLINFFDTLADRDELESYLRNALHLRRRLTFTGLLHHPLTRHLLPLAEVQLIPSTFPEAFGLVVLEGIASGTIPLIADHSGLRDVADIIEKELKVEPGMLRIRLDPSNTVFEIADKIVMLMSLPASEKARLSSEIAAIPRRLFSWPKIASDLINVLTEAPN